MNYTIKDLASGAGIIASSVFGKKKEPWSLFIVYPCQLFAWRHIAGFKKSCYICSKNLKELLLLAGN